MFLSYLFVGIFLLVCSGTCHEKVKVGFYYESLCPDCKVFMKKQLIPNYRDLQDIMELDMVPHGNAEVKEQMKDNKKIYLFKCQHGEMECLGNIIETCAIDIAGSSKKAFPFLACFETSIKSENTKTEIASSAKTCADKHHIDQKTLLDCVNSEKGNLLQHSMAVKTKHQKKLDHVPWITVNGIHDKDLEKAVIEDLVGVVCSTYEGKTKPHICPPECDTDTDPDR